MAVCKTLIAAFLLSLLVLQAVDAQELIDSHGPKRSLLGIDCGAACQVRCAASRRPNSCHRACATCCARCNCVPPGTSGNEEMCPCYNDQTTHGGQHKCP